MRKKVQKSTGDSRLHVILMSILIMVSAVTLIAAANAAIILAQFTPEQTLEESMGEFLERKEYAQGLIRDTHISSDGAGVPIGEYFAPQSAHDALQYAIDTAQNILDRALFKATPMVSAGSSHTAALKDDGTVWMWGWNENGQLGDGTATVRFTPVQISCLYNVIAIDANADNTAALKNDGTVWVWGLNNRGQIGDGTAINRHTPTQVTALDNKNIIAVSVGSGHIAALCENGYVWTWGFNNRGQLGDDSTTDRRTPVQVKHLSNVIAIATGDQHTLALCENGYVWSWGNNDSGNLGDGSTTERHTPVKVEGLSNVTAISASAAIKNDGSVWAWGWNFYGQLGDNSTISRHAPVYVFDNLISITAKNNHTAALRNDGTAWTWGRSHNGQLGHNNSVNYLVPTRIQSLSDVASIATGMSHTVALRNDGTVWAWGWNLRGTLGDNTTNTRHSPIQVRGANNIGFLNLGAVGEPPDLGTGNMTIGNQSTPIPLSGISDFARFPITTQNIPQGFYHVTVNGNNGFSASMVLIGANGTGNLSIHVNGVANGQIISAGTYPISVTLHDLFENEVARSGIFNLRINPRPLTGASIQGVLIRSERAASEVTAQAILRSAATPEQLRAANFWSQVFVYNAHANSVQASWYRVFLPANGNFLTVNPGGAVSTAHFMVFEPDNPIAIFDDSFNRVEDGNAPNEFLVVKEVETSIAGYYYIRVWGDSLASQTIRWSIGTSSRIE
jgi:alpha-tubulin suppressor-like RCC1 family protein